MSDRLRREPGDRMAARADHAGAVMCDLCHGYRGRVTCPDCDDDEPVTRDEPEPPDDYDYGRDAPKEE